MAVEKETFYTVRCDKCSSLLEDYVGELARLTYERTSAENAARKNGFVQISPRKWLCPHCAEELRALMVVAEWYRKEIVEGKEKR